MILFINACVRDESRTKRLAGVLLSKLEGDIEEIDLGKVSFPVADEAYPIGAACLIMNCGCTYRTTGLERSSLFHGKAVC